MIVINFIITSTKLYVPVVIFSINNKIKFLENFKQGFKRIVSWKKHKSEIIRQPKSNHLDCIIDSRSRSINTLFVQSFKTGKNDPNRDYFDRSYLSLFEIEDFNPLINNGPFVCQPVKGK